MAESNNKELNKRRDISFSTAAKASLGLVVVLVVLGLFLGGRYILSGNPEAKSSVLQSAITPSPEVASGKALKQLQATEEANLTTYGWLDRKNGIVHIPIERAMDLLLQRGLPTRP